MSGAKWQNELRKDPVCHWCGNPHLVIGRSEVSTDGFSVMCNHCGATGPFAKSRIGAIRRWKEGPLLSPIVLDLKRIK